MKTEAYTVLTEELLTKSVRREMPDHATTTTLVYRFLLEKYGGIQRTLEKWVTQLEHTAQTRHRGNRARLEAIEAASKLIRRFMSFAPTVPVNQLESLLSHPKILNRVLLTLQTQDIESFRVFSLEETSASPAGEARKPLLVSGGSWTRLRGILSIVDLQPLSSSTMMDT